MGINYNVVFFCETVKKPVHIHRIREKVALHTVGVIHMVNVAIVNASAVVGIAKGIGIYRYPHVGIRIHRGIGFLISRRNCGIYSLAARCVLYKSDRLTLTAHDLSDSLVGVGNIGVFVKHRVHSVSVSVKIYLVVR